MIILIGGEKGGTGKTTISTNISALMAYNNLDVLLVDTDKQGSASDWSAIRSENEKVKRVPCMQKFGTDIAKEIKDLSSRYQHIVIDAGGRDSIELRYAMGVCDVMFIPIRASQFDVWTLGSMDNLVSMAKALNPQLKSYVILNQTPTNPVISEAKATKEIFENYNHLKLVNEQIYDRIAYRKAAPHGLGVVEIDPLDAKACAEINNLYNQIGV